MIRAAIAVLAHPSLWFTALRQANRLVPARWWRRSPHLPVPSREYLRVRLQTQYGDTQHIVEPKDVLNYLQWCRDWER